MKFLCFLSTLFIVQCCFSQSNQRDPVAVPANITGFDSSEAKRHDSLFYATFYFYRAYIPKMNAPLKKVPIYVNDSLIHNLKANTYLSFKVYKEGKINISIDEKGETTIPMKVKFGKEYFFKCEVVKGLWFGKPTIEAVTPKIGRQEAGILTKIQ